jgi:hypothetical protein
MPPTASRVSDQFTSTEATGLSSMVVCTHCNTHRLPKNSLQRKEDHLRNCAAFATSPLATEKDASGKTMLEDSIARRFTRTKPGNTRINEAKESLRLQRIGAALTADYASNSPSANASPEGIQQGVERILRGVVQQRASELASYGTPHASPATFDTPSATNNETMAALLESATRATPCLNPRKRALPSDIDDDANSSPRLMSISQHLVGNMNASSSSANNNHNNAIVTPKSTQTTPQTSMLNGENNVYGKRLRHAEFYLDEDEFDFVCSAQTAREARYAVLVERLARLVRLRDTSGG